MQQEREAGRERNLNLGKDEGHTMRCNRTTSTATTKLKHTNSEYDKSGMVCRSVIIFYFVSAAGAFSGGVLVLWFNLLVYSQSIAAGHQQD